MGFGGKYEKRKRSMLNKKEEREKKGSKGKKEEIGSKRIIKNETWGIIKAKRTR
jgi:hypothetical protein